MYVFYPEHFLSKSTLNYLYIFLNKNITLNFLSKSLLIFTSSTSPKVSKKVISWSKVVSRGKFFCQAIKQTWINWIMTLMKQYKHCAILLLCFICNSIISNPYPHQYHDKAITNILYHCTGQTLHPLCNTNTFIHRKTNESSLSNIILSLYYSCIKKT